MGGLLYKDFISVSGKKLLVILSAGTVLYIVLRMLFPGTVVNPAFMVENEAGESINLLDSFFVMAFGILVVGLIGLLNGWVAKIVEGDTKNKIKGYLCAMPLGKNAYIASKYLFIGIAAYVFMSLMFIWEIACNAFCGTMFQEIITAIGPFIPSLICLALLSASIELPMFIVMGKQNAMLVKTAVILLIAFICIGFLMFGDLNWFYEHFNIVLFVQWVQTHTVAVAVIQVLSPVMTMLIYVLSYRITCCLKNKEADDHE